ncbi:hypothetical protein NKR19_g1541 [Coniochaeta hoffmannii]|uniref:Uncharacterized protein n=1 Tax=Coniochaeta hoffmannii TaxID=91930 RepID=A0AA38S0G1_9PEZI|nr:hypothetical protein NKR19_g1541 [Coniochaeta hoffmannii]
MTSRPMLLPSTLAPRHNICFKSTIVGLLEHWHSLLSGSITINGQTVEDLNFEWHRTNVQSFSQACTI